MPPSDHQLTTREVARFVAEGYLRFDRLISEELSGRVLTELQQIMPVKVRYAVSKSSDPIEIELPSTLMPLSDCYPAPSALGEMLRLPEVQGIIQSLVGADPVFDHDFVHFLPAGSRHQQHLHVDAVIDSQDPSFDIQLFYFPRDVAQGCGGTRMVPGSHLRRVKAEGVSRYQHLVGEQQYSGPAGTLMVFHHGMWHAGQSNPGDEDRWMYKIRLNPREPQVRLWNLDDFDDIHNDASDHTFAIRRLDSVAEQLREMQPWQQGHESRYEQVQRAKLWRYLTGDTRFDVDYYLTRLENRAEIMQGENH
jgi:hypothetical protein